MVQTPKHHDPLLSENLTHFTYGWHISWHAFAVQNNLLCVKVISSSFVFVNLWKEKWKLASKRFPFLFVWFAPKFSFFWKLFKHFYRQKKIKSKDQIRLKKLVTILAIRIASCKGTNHVALFVEKIYSWWQCSKITEKTVCLTLGLLTSGKLQIIFSSYYFDRKTEVS